MQTASKERLRLQPRGKEVMLPHGGLPEAVPPYLLKLIEETGGVMGPIGLQFIAQPEQEAAHWEGEASDPLIEDEHEVSPGLIYKYQAQFDDDGSVHRPGRALFTATFQCAAYCRFCTRGREVGVPAGHVHEPGDEPHSPHLRKEQIDQTLDFIAKEPGLNEIILSGGDPITIRPDVLKYILKNLGDMQRSGKLEIVRIGTRMPIHNPVGFKEAHYEAIRQLEVPRMMIHVNHPSELTPQAREVLKKLRTECNANLMSQTVLLKGVNDNPNTLFQVFREFTNLGGYPYIVYQNDDVYWAKHFTVPIEEARDIWKQMRPNQSGLVSTARFVIDTPGGYGKIPLPEGDAWDVDYDAGFRDFHGTQFGLK
jgi:lysine 2,3-aminomutase